MPRISVFSDSYLFCLNVGDSYRVSNTNEILYKIVYPSPVTSPPAEGRVSVCHFGTGRGSTTTTAAAAVSVSLTPRYERIKSRVPESCLRAHNTHAYREKR